MFCYQFIVVSRYSALKLGVPVRHVHKSKMRLGVLPILRIPSRELPINYRSNLTVAHDDIAWAEVCVEKGGSILTGMTQGDRFVIDLCITLYGDVSAEERVEVFMAEERPNGSVSYPVVEALLRRVEGERKPAPVKRPRDGPRVAYPDLRRFT
jgi:hypothetical protein